MIYEMRTYTVKAGELGTVVKNARQVGREIRGDKYGKMEGYWQTEIGPLNQVMHLWSFDSLDARTELRAQLANDQAWVNEYLPLAAPRLVRQDIRLMNAFLPLKAPAGTGNIYEFRNYRARVGKAREWVKHFTDIMPARERHSKNVCAWTTECGQPNEVCHLWAYADLNARAAARASAGKDPDWQAFIAAAGPLIDEAHSTILVPAAHSPLQ